MLEIWAVDPWGDERDDLRTRDFLRYVLAAHEVKNIPDDLMNYLGREELTTAEESVDNVRAVLSFNNG